VSTTSAPTDRRAHNRAPMAVDHYENFPVASWLCPAHMRAAVRAVYAFARTADDLADEGDAPQEQRLTDLAEYRQQLHRTAAGLPSSRWHEVFRPLQQAIERHGLPLRQLGALLDAFEQDVRNPSYADRTALLDYCGLSANPVGRLMLHLYGIDKAGALARSDAICSALQLINFWQDLSVDLPRGRVYVPESDAARHGLLPATLTRLSDGPATRALVRDLCDWARELMLSGAPLVHEVPGRAGIELRLVVQGGLRILAKIERMDHASMLQRPTLGLIDTLPIGWRAWRMRAVGGPLGHAA
jgi:squalene synthase HpnC